MARPSARALVPQLAPRRPPIHPEVARNGHGSDNGPWQHMEEHQKKKNIFFLGRV